MFRRIKILTLLQLSDRLKLKKSESPKKVAAKIGILLFSLIIISVVCSLLIYLVCEYGNVPENYNLMTFVIFFLQILSIIACTSGLSKTLYKGKDNPILLSYPAHHLEVFLSINSLKIIAEAHPLDIPHLEKPVATNILLFLF